MGANRRFAYRVQASTVALTAFTVGRCQGAGLLQTLFQLGQRLIHQRFYFRDIRRGTFLLEQRDGVFVFLDLLRGVGSIEGITVLVRA